jgi:arabinofuranosyltransferase
VTSSRSLSSTPTIFDSRTLILFGAYAAALVFRLTLFSKTGYTADDALIIFRYAENLAAGHGFVYNLGERVLGTTTPLYTLLLATLLKIKLNCFVGGLILNNLADLATAWVLLQMFRSEEGALSWLPAVLFLFSPESLQWSLSGMETELYIAFIFLTFYFASTESWAVAFLFAAITVLTRIDGIAVLGVLVVAYLLRYAKLPALPLVIFAVTVLPWILFAYFYFGSPIPNSAAAKFALSGSNILSAFSNILFRGFLHLHTFGIPVLILAVLGTGFIWKERKPLLPVALWTWGYALSYTLAAGPMHPWYYAPFYAGYLVIAFYGVVLLLTRYRRFTFTPKLVAFCAICVILLLSYYRYGSIQIQQARLVATNRAVGQWVQLHTPENSVLAAKDIGYIGYYSRRKILDLAGLVSPECIPFRAKADFVGPIRKFRPDYFAFSAGQFRTLGLESDPLMKNYIWVVSIGGTEGDYMIFKNVKMTVKE